MTEEYADSWPDEACVAVDALEADNAALQVQVWELEKKLMEATLRAHRAEVEAIWLSYEVKGE